MSDIGPSPPYSLLSFYLIKHLLLFDALKRHFLQLIIFVTEESIKLFCPKNYENEMYNCKVKFCSFANFNKLLKFFLFQIIWASVLITKGQCEGLECSIAPGINRTSVHF